MHPQTLPLTPYATACAHYTHRREQRWEIRAHCTSATTTGTRFGIMVLPDPTTVETIAPEMMWSAIENGLGAAVNSSGISSRSRTFSVRTATNILSNAFPGPGESHLGFAAGTLLIYLLDTPMGLGTDNKVQLVVLLRCELEPINKVPGFGVYESQMLHAPRHQPGPPEWAIKVSFNFSDLDNNPPMMGMNSSSTPYLDWAVYHTGNIPLAGGYYFVFANAGSNAPVISSTYGGKKSNVTIEGQPRSGAVYVTDVDFPPWRTNRNTQITPRFFACIRGWVSQRVYMVGFVAQQQAANQVDARFTMIPANAELCIRYYEKPNWGDFHPPTTTNQLDVKFWRVYTSTYVAEIYRGTSPITEALSVYDMPGTSGAPQQLAAAALTPSAPPMDSDWDETEDEEEQEEADTKPALPMGRPYAHHTTEELAQLYAQALQVVEDLEAETEARDLPERSDHATQASGSWWDLLKSRLLQRRKYLG